MFSKAFGAWKHFHKIFDNVSITNVMQFHNSRFWNPYNPYNHTLNQFQQESCHLKLLCKRYKSILVGFFKRCGRFDEKTCYEHMCQVFVLFLVLCILLKLYWTKRLRELDIVPSPKINCWSCHTQTNTYKRTTMPLFPKFTYPTWTMDTTPTLIVSRWELLYENLSLVWCGL